MTEPAPTPPTRARRPRASTDDVLAMMTEVSDESELLQSSARSLIASIDALLQESN